MINYKNKFDVSGKNVFVIGGLGLIGKEISVAFATSGARVVVFDIMNEDGKKFENEMNKKLLNVSFVSFDCSNLDQIDKSFSQIINNFNCPDIFINCSYPRTKDWGSSDFKNIKIDSFRKNVDMHMNSYSWLGRLAAEAMMKNNGGNIIQLGSIYGIVGQDLTVYEGTQMHENMSYAVIKGGITNLTRLMASYYGQFNIRVNTLVPGGLVGHVAGKSDNQNPKFVKQFNKKVPLRRLGKPEEIASTALFIASEAASYITGSTIIVDGGWTAI